MKTVMTVSRFEYETFERSLILCFLVLTGSMLFPFQAKYEATIESYKKKLGEYFNELLVHTLVFLSLPVLAESSLVGGYAH